MTLGPCRLCDSRDGIVGDGGRGPMPPKESHSERVLGGVPATCQHSSRAPLLQSPCGRATSVQGGGLSPPPPNPDRGVTGTPSPAPISVVAEFLWSLYISTQLYPTGCHSRCRSSALAIEGSREGQQGLCGLRRSQEYPSPLSPITRLSLRPSLAQLAGKSTSAESRYLWKTM